jgi:hypothetical protein
MAAARTPGMFPRACVLTLLILLGSTATAAADRPGRGYVARGLRLMARLPR